MPLPLEGIRVIDWTIWQQGPVATMMLADMGAEVIKIEHPVSGDPGRGIMKIMGAVAGIPGGRNFFFENNNRNKKSITVDVTKDDGREIIYRLAQHSDVFVQNFRKGVAEKLVLDYSTISRHNQRIIYANGTGFGSKGPDAEAPTYDLLGQARSGIMHSVEGNTPYYIVGGISDQAGAIMLAYGIVVALLGRNQFGIGQELDVSQLGAMIWLQNMNVASSVTIGAHYPPHSRTTAGNPLWNFYRCGDGKWLCLGMLQADRYWHDFCRALDTEHLEKDPRFANADERQKNCQSLIPVLDEVFASKSRDEWMKRLKESGDLIFTPINNVSDLSNDPQVVANEYLCDYDHPSYGRVKAVGVPIQLSRTPGALRSPAPEFGQHTTEVLREICGYSWEEIESLRDRQVI